MNNPDWNLRGFTLIESLLATLVLVAGIAAAAHVFSYAAAAIAANRDRTNATTLLVHKLERFKSSSLTDSVWTSGGSLDAAFPAAGFFDFVTVSADGTVIADSNPAAPFLRIWRIDGVSPRTVTVIVYAQRSTLARRPLELARGIASAAPDFAP
jgi:Tfp pilus assembly protein PilV